MDHVTSSLSERLYMHVCVPCIHTVGKHNEENMLSYIMQMHRVSRCNDSDSLLPPSYVFALLNKD